MGKKYMDTKVGTLEESILGVWQDAVDELREVVDFLRYYAFQAEKNLQTICAMLTLDDSSRHWKLIW